MSEPSAEQLSQIANAVILKATRLLSLVKAPLGTLGEVSEFGVIQTRPDYAINEALYGLRFQEWEVDWEDLVTVDDVIRQGLQIDPDAMPDDQKEDVGRNLEAAISWVRTHICEGIGIA